MKVIKKVIIVLIIIMLIIATTIFIMQKYKKINRTEEYQVDSKQDIQYNVITNIEKVQNHQIYYTIKNIIKKYAVYVQSANGDDDFENVNRIEKEQVQNSIKAMLDDEYLNMESNIQNIIKNLSKFTINERKEYYINIDDMYMSELSTDISLYMVYYTMNGVETEMLIKLDFANNTYSLYLEDFMNKYEYSPNMNVKNIKINTKSIKENDYNKFSYVAMSEVQIVKEYFNTYKKMILNAPKISYDLLDREYRNKRFGDYTEYYKYVEENKKEIASIQVSSYLIERYDNYTEYVCKDQYDNIYIFKETNVMKYTVILDTYTLPNEKFNTEYAKANNEKKVKMNIDKFFQMINAKDYTAAYGCLAESFKKNYFKTEEQFKKYMKQRVYSYNEVVYNRYNDEISGIHQFLITIKDKENSNKTTTLNIVMKLNEGINFEMSFEV